LGCAGNELTIAMLADKNGYALSLVKPEEREEVSMPKRKDEGLPRGAKVADWRAIENTKAPSPRESAQHSLAEKKC
jgi:hypothetical protein